MRRVVIVCGIAMFFAAVLYTTNGCGGVWSGSAMRVPQPEPAFEIEGTIRDATTGAPIPAAKIVVEQGAGKFVHDASSAGTYAVGGMIAGEAQVTVSAPGYQTTTRTISVVKGKNHLDLELTHDR